MKRTILLSLFILAFGVYSFAQNISGGESSGFSICPDGSLSAWGNNLDSTLGDGTNTNSNVAIAVNALTGVTYVSAGLYHSLAIKSDGTLWAWGQNYTGEFGSGNNIPTSTPVLTDFTNPIAVAGGGSYTIVIKSDSTVWTSGANNFGQLGIGNHTDMNVPQQVAGLSSIRAVASAIHSCVALKSDGTVWTWGRNNNGQLGTGFGPQDTTVAIQVPSLSGMIAIAACGYHVIAVKSDGTVWAWGNNLYGQLGDGTTNVSFTPVQVSSLTGVVSVAAGGYYSLALKSDGTVWAWGLNNKGQLGDGTTANSSVPVQSASLAGITEIEAGWAFSMAKKNDGTVWTYGTGIYGQLGNGTNVESAVPVEVTGQCQGVYVHPVKTKELVALVYPNPSNGKFTLKLQGATEVVNMEVWNTLGQKVYSTRVSGQAVTEIDMGNAAKGTYYLRASSGEQTYSTPITVQ